MTRIAGAEDLMTKPRDADTPRSSVHHSVTITPEWHSLLAYRANDLPDMETTMSRCDLPRLALLAACSSNDYGTAPRGGARSRHRRTCSTR